MTSDSTPHAARELSYFLVQLRACFGSKNVGRKSCVIIMARSLRAPLYPAASNRRGNIWSYCFGSAKSKTQDKLSPRGLRAPDVVSQKH